MVYSIQKRVERRKVVSRLSYQSRKLLESLLSGGKPISKLYPLFSFRNNLYKCINNLQEKGYITVSSRRPRVVYLTKKGRERLKRV